MKLIIKPVEHKHDNDCWCGAMALMTGKTYDSVKKMCKPFIDEDGGLDKDVILAYFKKENYFVMDITNVYLYKAIDIYNISDGALFILKDKDDDGHIVYMKGNKIYDNIEYTFLEKYLYGNKVIGIIMKVDNYYK